jgi:CRISPR system Cascade subunit CasD
MPAMERYLVVRLEGPLAAFGDTMVDAIGPVRDTPSTAMLTGLFANALGLRREDGGPLARLQDRLVFAARLDRRADRFVEFQTAALAKNDQGWTRFGRPEGRTGGADTYRAPHIRRRQHDADVSAVVAVRLDPAGEAPDLDRLAAALDEPFRPLFLGRKPCLPAERLFAGFVTAPDLFAALLQIPLAKARKGAAGYDRAGEREAGVRVVLPADAPRPAGIAFAPLHVCDRRDWSLGVHVGEAVLHTATLPRGAFPAPTEDGGRTP